MIIPTGMVNARKEAPKKDEDAKPDDNVTTIDEIFGETSSNEVDSLSLESDLMTESPIQSLIEIVQGDMAVNTKNLYSLNKLLSKEEVQLKLKSSSGQFLFSNDSEPIGTSGEYYRLYLSLIHI